MPQPDPWTVSLAGTLSAWPLLAVLVLGMVLVWVLVNGAWLFPGTRPLRRAFHCPYRGQDVDVEFSVAAWDGRAVDVRACSAFAPPTCVTCDKRCLGGSPATVTKPSRP
jgi:hypothetical protein